MIRPNQMILHERRRYWVSGVVIRTENQSVYTIEKIPGSSFKYFSNIKFNNGNKLLIEDPGMISIGSPFAFRFVDDYRNGPLSGKCVETSPITSIVCKRKLVSLISTMHDSMTRTQ